MNKADRAGSPKAFVLGRPIKHSKSPALHLAAYGVLGEPIAYERLETGIEDLGAVFAAHGPADATCGFSVTMPLKEAVLEQVDEVSAFARAVGVVNTVYWRQDADGGFRSYGHNTDVSGIVNALAATGCPARVAYPAIVGGGGTATAALAALAYMGAERVRVFVRDESRAQLVKDAAQRLSLALDFAAIADFPALVGEHPVTVCTLPAGAADSLLGAEPLAASSLVGHYLLDVSYDPWPSVLAQGWEEAGGRVTSGLEMLMYQALDQVKLFTGRNLDDDLPQQGRVLDAMCAAVGLPSRPTPVLPVFEVDRLLGSR